MRLLTYNILDGGEGRADPLAEVILAQRADVVALVEADVPAVVERIAKRLGMDYAIGQGGTHAAALLSRWPLLHTVNHAALDPRLTRAFLEAVVQSPAGQAWPIGVIHLPAQATEAAEDARIHELAIALDRFKGHRVANRPHLICGDFNSNAPYQRIDPARCKIKTQEAYAANGHKLPTRVVEAMVGCGYLDTYHVLRDERQELVGSFTTQHPGQRVDYVFAFAVPAHHVRDAWVERDRLAKYASDHFPVGVEITEGD